jgi:hypothetical protein
MAQAQAYYTSCVPPQPLDKVSLNICYLYSFPSYLQLVVPYVNAFQAMEFKEENSIKIFDINYNSFLSFIKKCITIYMTPERPDQDLTQTINLQDVVLTFNYNCTCKEFSFSIENPHVKFSFCHQLIPLFVSGIRRLLFKTFGYSHNINFLVTQYLRFATSTIIQNPTYSACQEIFNQLEAPFVDYFLLLDIVERHKKVLKYLKLFEPFQQ